MRQDKQDIRRCQYTAVVINRNKEYTRGEVRVRKTESEVRWDWGNPTSS